MLHKTDILNPAIYGLALQAMEISLPSVLQLIAFLACFIIFFFITYLL